MTSTPLAALTIRHGLAEVDSRNIDAFLAAGEPPHALLFFTGDPAVRLEAADVAVALPELLAFFRGRLRAAVVARTAEDALKVRFHVAVLPSLVLVRGSETLGVLARIRTWPDYVARISAWLDPATPAMAPASAPRVAFTYSGQGSQA
jgi:hydrogenase-1 operon protein HyaE